MPFRLDFMLESIPDDMLHDDDNMLAHSQANWRIYEERWLLKQEDLAARAANKMWRAENEKRGFPCRLACPRV